MRGIALRRGDPTEPQQVARTIECVVDIRERAMLLAEDASVSAAGS
jgi:hypothetical protein